MVVTIRPYRIEDAPRLFEAAIESIPVVHPWLEWCHPGYRLAEAESWLDEQVRAFAAHEQFEFAIEAQDGRFLGGCGINRIDAQTRSANVGYWVRTTCSRAGVATEATRKLAAWAFANTALARLEIVVAVGNLPSMRVAEKVGAAREGLVKSRLTIHGTERDAIVFALAR